ncbi:Acetyltransferase [Hyella patelloides LEGE 07179]|uniref:Acetyltransferase n=1 Tax=Hyella patelloides LEGE 07179 TaxID=945734 RepID=A0A563VZV4_9CYAN|nr:acyltransferase [Hyella patelloides]VEP16992.1 Acetyltransferase [Hyella patelloides LEGE 07179]
MIVKKILQNTLPIQWRIYLRKKLNSIIRQFKTPKMLWGYQNASGQWQQRTRISDTVFFYYPKKIYIQDNVFIWHYTILDGTGGLEIGEGSQIGAWVGIFTHSSHIAIRIYGNHYQEITEKEKKGYKIAPVKIGKYVFIGAGSKIFPGVKIGEGALISAGSFVTKDVKEFEIVSGNPAEVIGNTKKLDRRYMRDSQLKEWYEEWQRT